jgi:hypothetical protein
MGALSKFKFLDADATLTIPADFDWPGEIASNPHRQMNYQPKGGSSIFSTHDQICFGASNLRAVTKEALLVRCGAEEIV